ncbi:MAG: IS200/IS605 family transposase [Chloroflexales bacterium]|nr:IS200/IS605 family transposase [Chloroflexales bacterium]
MSAERYRPIRGSVSTLTYHFVWCPKYRRKVLTGAVAARLHVLIHERAAALSLEIVALDVMPDHVHLFVQAPPTLAPQPIANQLKGATARVLRDAFPHLRSRLPSLWSRSYYVGSAGAVSADTIQRYLEQQKAS